MEDYMVRTWFVSVITPVATYRRAVLISIPNVTPPTGARRVGVSEPGRKAYSTKSESSEEVS